MTYTTAIFYFFAAILVFAGLRVITARNPVHAALFLVLAFFIGSRHFGLDVMASREPDRADYSNTKELGRLLYTDYVCAFELAAVILLVAIVAAIALPLRPRKASKYIDPAEQ